MNKVQRFQAIKAIGEIWYNEDGPTDTTTDFKALYTEVTRLYTMGKTNRWKMAVTDWQDKIRRACKMFCHENGFGYLDGFQNRSDFTGKNAEEYDRWFHWALIQTLDITNAC